METQRIRTESHEGKWRDYGDYKRWKSASGDKITARAWNRVKVEISNDFFTFSNAGLATTLVTSHSQTDIKYIFIPRVSVNEPEILDGMSHI